jgi:hypothetical protein
MQRFFVDSNDDVQDPIGYMIDHDFQSDLSSHTVVMRREVGEGGNDSNGFRQYTVGAGARPTTGTSPGDPSEAQPIALEVEYTAEKSRSYVVHQPSGSTTLDIENTDSSSIDVTIENEGATTSETVTVPGNSTATTTSSFSDIDAIWAESEPGSKIEVTDGGGTTILEDGLQGSSEDGAEGDRGIPKLESGSHASVIGTDPEDFQFMGTSSNFGSGEIAPRVHALDLTIEFDVSTEAQQGSRRMSIDVGPRTVEVEGDTAGKFDTHQQHVRHLRGTTGDIDYVYADAVSGTGGTVTVKSAQVTDVGDQEYSEGDANVITSNTFQGQGDPEITQSHA